MADFAGFLDITSFRQGQCKHFIFFRNAAQSLLWNLRQVFFALVPGVPKWEAAAWVRKREDTWGSVLAVAGHTLETAYAPNTAHGNYVHDSARLFVGLKMVCCTTPGLICLLSSHAVRRTGLQENGRLAIVFLFKLWESLQAWERFTVVPYKGNIIPLRGGRLNFLAVAVHYKWEYVMYNWADAHAHEHLPWMRHEQCTGENAPIMILIAFLVRTQQSWPDGHRVQENCDIQDLLKNLFRWPAKRWSSHCHQDSPKISQVTTKCLSNIWTREGHVTLRLMQWPAQCASKLSLNLAGQKDYKFYQQGSLQAQLQDLLVRKM